jgi:hypothetical protein
MAYAVRDFIQRIDFESEFHTALGAELIDQHLRSGVALYVLEEQRRTAGSAAFAAVSFADAIGNFRDLKNGIDFGADLLQFASAFERGNKTS